MERLLLTSDKVNTMKINEMIKLSALISAAALLQACAGVRDSSADLTTNIDDQAVMTVARGEVNELLAIGNGFPGWWGYYPAFISSKPDIASIECEDARSFIPFREPGIIFGGKICSLHAHQVGETTLFFGNKWALGDTSQADRTIKVNVIE